MNHVRCQMCQHLTHKPWTVLTYGWNRELQWPTRINLCERCKDLWVPETHVEYIDVGCMTKKEAEKVVEPIWERYFGTVKSKHLTLKERFLRGK